MRKRLIFIAIATALAAAAIGFIVFRPDRAAKVAAGVAAQMLCSRAFVSGQPADATVDEMLGAAMGPVTKLVRYAIDAEGKSVEARFGLFTRASARFSPGYGCRLDAAENAPLPAPPPAETAPPDDSFAPPSPVTSTDSSLNAALDRVFGERAEATPKRVKAVVVVKDGRVVAERYAPGYSPDTPVRSFSIAKSFTNALLAILVRDRRLKMADPFDPPEWRAPGDPRAAITFEELLRMESGLDASETGSGFDPVSRMLYAEPDMAGFAASRPLKAKPGELFDYTSVDTLLLDRWLSETLGGPAGLRAFAERELFAPLGMRSVTMEFDGRGVFVGSERVFATPRDFARFGMLFLNDGVAPGGRRILPEGWVAWSRRSTLGAPYGAGFWTLDGPSESAARWAGAGFPKDGFFATGNLGQRIYIAPSQKLIIARFGYSAPPTFGIFDDIALIAAAIKAN
jgi:CubicO group peptidase (beta-lactamase class C family)